MSEELPAGGKAKVNKTRHIAARVADVGPGDRIKVTIGRRAIALFNIDGEFFAIGDTCPHEFGSLCKGKLVGLAQSDAPGEYRLERKGEFVKCPWHGWEFDIRTGQSWCDPQTMRVRTFDASIAEGADIVAAGAQSPEGKIAPVTKTAQNGDPAKGPYVAETFTVHVEDQYVIIEL